jgi:hypothetical protein
MMRIQRNAVLFAALVLVVAACGGDDDAGGDATTSAPPSETTTSAAAEPTTTTEAPATTTSAAPETTTTAAAETTTTTAPPATSEDAAALVNAKTAAAIAAIPADWTSAPVDSDTDAADSDEIYGPCAGEGAFDLTGLDAATVAIATVDLSAPQGTGFFPPPSATIEARVFESEAVAEDAFGVLEAVLGTDEGRTCVADRFIELVGEGSPDDAEFSIDIQEVIVPGADVGARLLVEAAAEGITIAFQFDLTATRDGNCTVYGTFISFGDPVLDPDIRDAIFEAATGV